MRRALTVLGYAFCIIPATVAALEHFPLWLADGQKSLSLFALFLLALAVLPLWRTLKKWLRSPSAWMIWLILFLCISLFRSIADGLWRISLVALCGSLIGAVCFALAKHVRRS